MSTHVTCYNYNYQGQVLSPAFSEPASPCSSTSSSCYSDGEMEPDSPDFGPISPKSPSTMTCISPKSPTSTMTCDNNKPPLNVNKRKRSHSDGEVIDQRHQRQEFRTKVPRFANKYEEMLQPLSPVTTLPCDVVCPPSPNSKFPNPKYCPKLQNQLQNVINTKDNINLLDQFLYDHSTKVNINQYNLEGRTALQQSCVDGNLALAKVLVKYGADHRITTREGYPTLQCAVFSGHSEIFLYILNLRKISANSTKLL